MIDLDLLLRDLRHYGDDGIGCACDAALVLTAMRAVLVELSTHAISVRDGPEAASRKVQMIAKAALLVPRG